MTQIILYIAVSLDGFIADAGGGVDWLPPGDGGDDGGDDKRRYADFYAAVSALIMGRRTYDQVRQFGDWPYPGKPVYVFTTRPPDDTPPPGVRFIQIDAAAFARTVASQHTAGPIWLVGGADLANQFRIAGLIDEYRVFVIPIILGQGVPLFGGPGVGDAHGNDDSDADGNDAGKAAPTPLRLVAAQTYADGIAMLRYRPAETG